MTTAYEPVKEMVRTVLTVPTMDGHIANVIVTKTRFAGEEFPFVTATIGGTVKSTLILDSEALASFVDVLIETELTQEPE